MNNFRETAGQPHDRLAYEQAQEAYEKIRAEIGGNKTDEELLALMIERGEAQAFLDRLRDSALEEGLAINAEIDKRKEAAEAFHKLSRPEQLKELLRRELESNVLQVPEGRFSSDLPGVEQLTVLHPQKKDGETAHSFSVYVSYRKNEDAKLSGETFTVTDEGRVLGNIPQGWGFKKEELVEEIVRLVDDVGDAFFVSTDESILPRGTWETETRHNKTGKSRSTEEKETDRRRLRFFKNHPGALFGFRGEDSTLWEGYHGFAFSDRIILDAPKVGNAVYILPLADKFPVAPEQLQLPPAFRLEKKDCYQYLREHWAPYAGLTKKESLENGATRVIHPDFADVNDQWEKKMREKLHEVGRQT